MPKRKGKIPMRKKVRKRKGDRRRADEAKAAATIHQQTLIDKEVSDCVVATAFSDEAILGNLSTENVHHQLLDNNCVAWEAKKGIERSDQGPSVLSPMCCIQESSKCVSVSPQNVSDLCGVTIKEHTESPKCVSACNLSDRNASSVSPLIQKLKEHLKAPCCKPVGSVPNQEKKQPVTVRSSVERLSSRSIDNFESYVYCVFRDGVC